MNVEEIKIKQAKNKSRILKKYIMKLPVIKNRFLYVVLLFILTVTSCVKDNSVAPTPSNNDPRAVYTGTWECTENTPSNPKFRITISVDAKTQSGIKIYNINQLGSTFFATGIVTGSTFNIPKQTISLDYYEGGGQISNDKISLFYKITDANNVSQDVKATCTRI
jgi:hypothetical protein